MFTHRTTTAAARSSDTTQPSNSSETDTEKHLLFSKVELLDDAIQILRSTGLVQQPDSKVLWMHDLFGTIGSHEMQEDMPVRRSLAILALGIASRAFTWPEYSTWDLHRSYLPFLQVCISVCDSAELPIRVMSNLAHFYKLECRYDEALQWDGRALAGKEKALGKDHPFTLFRVSNTATATAKKKLICESRPTE